MDKFFRDAVKTGDRILLVGNTRRREGVEAGKPLARIERNELAAGAKVETIQRQRKETDRQTVKKLSEEKIIEAVGEMRGRGQVREIKDRDERHNSIVEAFTAAPEKSLVVAPRNADRQEINFKIRQALKESGKIGKEEIEIKILRPRNDTSGVGREFAAAYREGDIITYTRGSKENTISAKSLAKVIKTDWEQNLLIVEIKDGEDSTEVREVTYNPKRLRGVSTWTEEKIKVSEGDRLQFRAPLEEKKTKIAKDAMFEVSKITAETLTLRDDKGKIVKLKTNQPHAIDYGYAAASQNSQEKTINRILIHAKVKESKPILNDRIARVAFSRTRDEALIFTDNAEKLVEQMARQIEKTDIAQVKTETIKSVPERAAKIVFDTQQKVEKADRSEIKSTVILPSAEKSAMPAIVIESAQQSSVVAKVKPEAESKEIKPSAIVPLVEKSATPAIEVQPALEDVFPTSYAPTHNQKISIKELVQLSRTSAEQQGLFHSEKAWSWLETIEFPDLATREIPENHRQFVDFLQKDLPEYERVNLSGKSELESTHAILKLIPIEKCETIVNGFFADYYKSQNLSERLIKHAPEQAEKTVLDAKPQPVKVERGEINQPEVFSDAPVLLMPEIKTPQPQQKTADSATDAKKRQNTLITDLKEVKPAPKVRDFEAIEREELIRELVAAARDEARTRTGKDFSYKQGKRLTKMYRQAGDNPPTEQQVKGLNSLQERFSAPLPPPKNFIEATVLILDNSTDAEKSARLRGQMIKIDELIKREEAQKTETAFERTAEDDPFGRTDSYFTQELHCMNFETSRKSYFELTKEAELRNLTIPYKASYSLNESMQEKQMQQALYQMGIANALQEQVKNSLEEQGIKIEVSAQRIINKSIDSWSKQPPTSEDYKNVESINQSREISITPRTKLEARTYVFAKSDDRERDKISCSLAAEASEKAAELKIKQVEEVKRNREMTQENPYIEGQTQTRGRTM